MSLIHLEVVSLTIMRFRFPNKSFLASVLLAMALDDSLPRRDKAYSHWVRITSCFICWSEELPGIGS